jgi:2-dehydro-3-deoxygalactonokinase
MKLIGLDWGTSSLRAFLMHDGRVIETRSSSDGIQSLATGGTRAFERAFAAIAGDWLQPSPALPVVACGMVGSAQGWREAPYVPCPADARALAARGVRVASVSNEEGPEILIAPGVLFDAPGGVPDVMRGEEIQVAGALLHESAWSARSRIVLPGTHSKWVRVDDGRIVALATYLTGEMFAVLKTHSILGRLMTAAVVDARAFAQGVERARNRPGDLLHHVFAARTLGLTQRMPHESLAEYLSGLLIGHELVSALAAEAESETQPLVLVGDHALCERYAVALRHLGRTADAVLDNTAPAGLWSFARAAGLIAS